MMEEVWKLFSIWLHTRAPLSRYWYHSILEDLIVILEDPIWDWSEYIDTMEVPVT